MLPGRGSDGFRVFADGWRSSHIGIERTYNSPKSNNFRDFGELSEQMCYCGTITVARSEGESLKLRVDGRIFIANEKTLPIICIVNENVVSLRKNFRIWRRRLSATSSGRDRTSYLR